MKKKSLKDIEGSGWTIPNEDRDRIDRKKAQSEMLKSSSAIAESLGVLATATTDGAKASAENSKVMSAMLVEQNKITRQIADTILKLKPHDAWDFDVKRNEKGFISKIFAKGIK